MVGWPGGRSNRRKNIISFFSTCDLTYGWFKDISKTTTFIKGASTKVPSLPLPHTRDTTSEDHNQTYGIQISFSTCLIYWRGKGLQREGTYLTWNFFTFFKSSLGSRKVLWPSRQTDKELPRQSHPNHQKGALSNWHGKKPVLVIPPALPWKTMMINLSIIIYHFIPGKDNKQINRSNRKVIGAEP